MKTKEEFLEYANKHYPIGTVYKSAEYTNLSLSNCTVQGRFTYYSNDDYITDGYGGFVYYKGKWSDIISYNFIELDKALKIIYED